MNSNINKKKISFLINRKFLKYIFIIIIFFLFFFYFYHQLIIKDKFSTIIQDLSEKYNYQLKKVEINSLKKIKKSAVNNIINEYYKRPDIILKKYGVE